MNRRAGLQAAGVFLAFATFLIAGCASLTGDKAGLASEMQWSGRLSIKVFGAAAQAFAADFDLSGNPQAGALVLYSPLGTTAAQMRWTPDGASLISAGETRHFATLNALVLQATGTELPVQALFDWLQGRPTNVPGWTADLSALQQGRLLATRIEEGPARAELRIVLQP